METPETTKGDIVDEEPIDIAAKVLQKRTFDDGNTQVRLKDTEGEELDLKIWDGDYPTEEIETDCWYRIDNALGDVYKGTVGLGSNRGEIRLNKLSSPPGNVQEVQSGSASDNSAGTDVVALDIETVSQVPEEEFEFENSDHVELLCIGIGYAPTVGQPGDSEVLFRSGTTPASEAELLDELCEYVETHDPDRLVMFKGDFDKTHLLGRAERLAEIDSSLNTRVESIFTEREFVNLDPWGSLEENADVPPTYWDVYVHSLDPAEWRADHPRYNGDLSDPRVTNKDVPYFGERFLELCETGEQERERRALRELLRHYTVTDIRPLFDLIG